MRRRRTFRGTVLTVLVAFTALSLAPPLVAAADLLDPLPTTLPSDTTGRADIVVGALAVASVGAGETLRYRGEEGPWRTAQFVSFTEDGNLLVRARGEDPVALDPRHVRLSLSQGTRGHTGTGFLVGASIGAVLGAAADNTSDEGLIEVEYSRGGLIFLGAAFYGLIGGVLGSFVRTPEWREVQLFPRDRAVLHGTGSLDAPDGALAFRAEFLRLDW